MSIELTSEEKSNLIRQKALEQAMKNFRKNLAEDIANKKISKRKISNELKVKEIKKKAKHSANKAVKAFEKGWMF